MRRQPSEDRTDESTSTSRRGRLTHFLDTTTKQITAVAGMIAAIATLVVALKPSSSSSSASTQITQQALHTTTPHTSTTGSKPSVHSTNAKRSPGFEAFTLAQPKLTVRAAPSNAARASAQLRFHASVWIVCTQPGDSVTGAGSITSTTWDRVRTRPSDPPVGFVPDAWVETGTTSPTEPSC